MGYTLFNELLNREMLSQREILSRKITSILNNVSFKQFSSLITDIPKYHELEKYTEYFLKLPLDQITKLLYEQYLEQVNSISQTCIDRFELNSNKIGQIERIIVNTLGTDKYLEIVRELTDYKLFTQGIYKVYLITTAIGLTLQNKLFVSLSVLSYSVFVYSLLVKKYMRYCRADIFNMAVANAHKNNMVATNFMKGGHLAIVEYVAISELNKFLKYKTFRPKEFTRMFTYIKHRFNQSLKFFFNSTYYKYFKQYKEDIKNSTNQHNSNQTTSLTLLVKEIIHAHRTVSEIPEAYIDQIGTAFGIDDIDFLKHFFKEYINITRANEKVLTEYYLIMFQEVPFTNTKEICLNAYYKKLMEFLKSKRPEAVRLKQILQGLTDTVIERMGITVSNAVRKQMPKIVFVINYFTFVKHTVCH